jgi:hypothetical protein
LQTDEPESIKWHMSNQPSVKSSVETYGNMADQNNIYTTGSHETIQSSLHKILATN